MKTQYNDNKAYEKMLEDEGVPFVNETPRGQGAGEDYEIQQAIAASIKQQQQENLNYDKYYVEDFNTPEESIRESGMEIGLKNVRNCKCESKCSMLFEFNDTDIF
jgi:hypothetical protein